METPDIETLEDLRRMREAERDDPADEAGGTDDEEGDDGDR